MKKLFQEYIPQVVLIVFSVVLGLFLSEEISKRQDKKMAEQLVGHLKKEISHNREEILEWMPYHYKLRNKLDSAIGEEVFIKSFINDPNVLFEHFDRGLFNGTINTAAWETAVLNPAVSEISYEQLTDFSKVYKQIDITYKPLLVRLQDLTTAGDFNASESAAGNLQTLITLIQELAGREYSLLANCNMALGDTLEPQNKIIGRLIKRKRKQLEEERDENN